MSAEKIFISYAHKDESYCKEICKILTNYGLPYWQDDDDLPPSADDFNEIIEEAIDVCKYFVCVWTTHIKDSDYCKKELERAFEWKSREPDRCIYILKMEENLDNLTDLPKGCNLHVNGTNISYAYNTELLNSVIERIANQLMNGSIGNGLSKEEFINDVKKYVDRKIESFKGWANFSPKVVDKRNEEHDDVDITNSLINGQGIFLHGERGCGRTTFILNVYIRLLNSLRKALEDGAKELYVPIYIELENMWNWNAVVVNNVLQQLCGYFLVPYCKDNSIKYIVLLDGEMRTTRGYLPEVVDKMIDENSGIYSLLISQIVAQFLNGNFIDYKIRALNFSEVVAYIVKKINNEVQIGRFFKRLLNKAFVGTSIDEDLPNIFFKTIKNVYKCFENEELLGVDDFYSISLAQTTQKGRLPKTLVNDDEILAWKRLIKGNEVFHAIRNPYYLNQLIDLFLGDKELIFPYRLRTLQTVICQTIINRLDEENELVEKAIQNFLIPLAKKMESEHNANLPITLSCLRRIVKNTNFDRIKMLLHNGGIINIANEDIAFQHDFLYDYFLNYADSSHSGSMEAKLLTCRATELPQLFISYISHGEVFEDQGKDSLEIAADIILDERDSFDLTQKEREQVIEIVRKRLSECEEPAQKASILNGVAKMFQRLDLIHDEKDFFNLSDKYFWYKLSEKEYVARFPITNFHYNIFISEGYQNEAYWKYGRDSIKLSDGSYRKRPLKSDEDIKCTFETINHPVVGISWFEAMAFCSWLSDKLNSSTYEVTLPLTEQMKKFITSVDVEDGRYNAVSAYNFNSTTPIACFENDQQLLVDVIGNVWEWGYDNFEFYGDQIAKCYGGAWSTTIDLEHILTTYPCKLSSNNIGFRVIVNIK